MKTAHCEIVGNRPYFFTKPFKEVKTPKTDEQKKQSAINRIYCNGTVFVPSKQITASMVNAVGIAKMKMERSMKRVVDLLNSPLFQVNPEEIHFKPAMKLKAVSLVEMFTPTDMGKGIWNFYAFLEAGWKLEFDMLIGEVFEPAFMKEILENAGLLAGIGGKRKYNGRSDVIKFKLS